MTDDLYLTRADRRQLEDLLATIPALLEDLINVETRQARLTKKGLGTPRRPKKMGASLPYHSGAADAHDRLHFTLAGWVQVVATQRGLDRPDTSTIAMAAWLRRNAIALSLCEGSAHAYDDIADRVHTCRKVIDLPPDDLVIIDQARVEKANKSVVTLSTVGVIASRLGDIGKGLDRERLRLLAKQGKVQATGTDGSTKFYQLGDVLRAHHEHKTRRRGY